jgi:hypothetical protein
MRARIVLGVGTMLGLGACDEPADPCDRYIDYMCACHDGEDGVTCGDLEATYGNADPDVQDQCAILLGDQQGEDDDAGIECEV